MANPYRGTTGPNNKIVDRATQKAALEFLSGCGHLTPAKEADLDNLLASIRRPPETEDVKTVCEPDPDVIAVLEATPEPDWMEAEPDASAFEYEADGDEADGDEAERDDVILTARAAFEA